MPRGKSTEGFRKKKVVRAGKRKCCRCKVVWDRPKGNARKICSTCESHCSRCNVEITDDNRSIHRNKSMCAGCRKERQNLSYHNTKLTAVDYRLNKKYGITLPEYEAILKAQGGACWICEKPPKEGGNRLAVDHLHSKGEKKRNPREMRGRCRGLLCWHCNAALGKFGDSVTKLRRAAAYLEAWPAQKILKKEEQNGE